MPELNLGRAPHDCPRPDISLDAIGLNKVQGKPFSVAEKSKPRSKSSSQARRSTAATLSPPKPKVAMAAAADGGG